VKQADGSVVEMVLGTVSFVPLVGEQGMKEGVKETRRA